MARIRRLKPEIWQSADFSQLSLVGRLTFIALVTQADDEGRLRTDAKHLALAFLHDPSLTREVDLQLRKMTRLNMISRYVDADSEPCLSLNNFSSHQNIERPTASRIEKPPEIHRALGESSPRPHRALSRLSKEGRKEGRREVIPPTPPSVVATANGGGLLAVPYLAQTARDRVFQAWVASTQRSGRTRLDGKRQRLIDQALELYSEPDCVDAVRGWRHSPHHRGENDRATVYNDLELLLRDAKHIEMFRDLERGLSARGAGPTSKSEQLSNSFREQAAALRAQGL